MRASQTFLPPYRKSMSSGRLTARRMLIDGGFIRVLADGLYAWMPLGMQVLRTLAHIISREMERLEGQEILLPMLNPESLWHASGRYRLLGSELMRTQDQAGQALVLAHHHDEALAGLLKEMLTSREQLPAFFYQIQGKVQDAATLVTDLMQSREFISCDAWGVHRSYTDLNNFIPHVFRMFFRVFNLCSLEPQLAEGVPAVHGVEGGYDFVVPARNGDYRLVSCEKCAYAADQQVALGLSKISYSRPLGISGNLTTSCARFKDLPKVIGLPGARVAICQVWNCANGRVMTVIRADQSLSLVKLSRVANIPVYSLATEQELRNIGLVPEFLSPLDYANPPESPLQIRIIVDSSIAETPNLVMGANREGCYVANANFGRDFEGDVVGDISLVDERNRCYHCGGPLRVTNAIRLANIARLDDYYTQGLGVVVPDGTARGFFPLMSAAEIRFDRLVSAIAQNFQDKRGLCWPMTIAPFKAVVIVVGKSGRLNSIAESVYSHMKDLILWDDRPGSFLRKLRDADRMGIPLRIVISAQTLEDGSATLLQRNPLRLLRVPLSHIKTQLLEWWKEEKNKTGCVDEV